MNKVTFTLNGEEVAEWDCATNKVTVGNSCFTAHSLEQAREIVGDYDEEVVS